MRKRESISIPVHGLYLFYAIRFDGIHTFYYIYSYIRGCFRKKNTSENRKKNDEGEFEVRTNEEPRSLYGEADSIGKSRRAAEYDGPVVCVWISEGILWEA